jgi:hypothetical protein
MGMVKKLSAMSKVAFSTVKPGDRFVYGDNIFTRAEVASRQFNAKDVQTNELWQFSDTDEVLLLEKVDK